MSGSGAGQDQEIEIKFRTDAAGLARLLDAPLIKTARDHQTEILKTTYSDTPSNALRKKGVIVRVRKSGDAAPVLGMKALGGEGPFHRKEVEVNSPSLKPNLALFDKTTRKFLEQIIGDLPLATKFKMEIKRESGLVTSGASVVEIAVDQGHISCGKQRVPLAEVELELVSGNKADLIGLAMRLAEDFSLRLDFVSKAEKGFHALLGEKPAPVNAAPIRSKSLGTLDDAVTAIVSNTLAQFVANWACLRETDEPESIHQMRIALRRMRCGLLMFKRASPHPAFEALRDDAGHQASIFGPVRSTDAFYISVLEGPLESANRPESSGALRTVMEKKRIAAYAQARSEMDSLAATRFVLKVQRFLACHDWREVSAEAEPAKLRVPLRKFSRAALNKLRARVLKRGKAATDSDEARHKLRIALKNLRYGVDFFSDLFGNAKRRRTYKKKLSALQDLLGTRNDIVGANKFLKEIRAEIEPNAERIVEFILGWYAQEAAVADKAIGKSWKKFKHTEIFWN